MDIRTNVEDGKIMFQNGQIFTTLNKQESLRQRLDIRIKTQKGTWFLNISYGIDWFNDVFSDTSTKYSVDALIQAEILKEELVASIVSFTSSVNEYTREYRCDFKVKMIDQTVSDSISLLANEKLFVVLSDGGTAIIIVVGVALETVKQIESQMLMRHYKGFLK